MVFELFEVHERQANVVVVNNTGVPLKLVTVVHKYSDNYVDKDKWENVDAGATTRAMTVRYHTGSLTTGRDWWLVVMMTEDGHVFGSSPANFRGMFDTLEGLGKKAAEALRSLATPDQEAVIKIIAEGLAAAVDGLWSVAALNDGVTDGFKQHILRDEDDTDTGTLNKIVISGLEGSNTIQFQSHSGNSTTQTKRFYPPS